MTISHTIDLSHRPLALLAIAVLGVALLGGAPASAVAESAAGLPFETRCSGWLANISTRGQVGGGDRVLIAGFIVEGAPVTVALRALGPTLADRGVAGSLVDPGLELFRGQARIAANAGWRDGESAAELARRGLAPAQAREPALLVSLEPGEYSAIVRGAGGGEGVGMVEVFQTGGGGELSNLSTRGSVGAGDAVLIGGLIVKGGPTTVAIRALGPSLAAHGVAGALADPTIDLFRGQTRIAANDNWEQSYHRWQTAEMGQAPPDTREAVIVVRLNPGEYTAVVRGAAGATGVAMVEVFRVLDIAGPHVDLIEEAAVDVAPARQLVVEGSLGFAAGGDCVFVPRDPSLYDCTGTLSTLAIDNSTAPVVLGEYFNPDEAIVDVDIHAGHAFVTLLGRQTNFGRDFRLAIMPVAKLIHQRRSDPPGLAEVASLPLAGDLEGDVYFRAQAAVGGGRLYVILLDGIGIFSLEAPAAPAEIGRVDIRAASIAVSGTRLFVLLANPKDQEDEIQIFDVTDPAVPVLAGGVASDGSTIIHPPLQVLGARLFVVVEFPCRSFPEPGQDCFIPRQALEIYDIADPGRPVKRARFGSFQWAYAFALAGERLHLVDSGVVRSLDVAHPDRGQIGQYPPVRDFGYEFPVQRDGIADIATSGDRLYALGSDAVGQFTVRRLRAASCSVGIESSP